MGDLGGEPRVLAPPNQSLAKHGGGVVIAAGHAPEQGRAARRRAVWKHRGSGSLLLVSRVAWGESPDLSLPQFPHWQNGGVSAA